MASLNDSRVRSVDDIPGVATRLARQRFIVSWSRALSLGSFAVVLFIVIRIAGDSTNHVWFLPVFVVLAAGILVNVYSLLVRFRLVGVHCPRCDQRFGRVLSALIVVCLSVETPPSRSVAEISPSHSKPFPQESLDSAEVWRSSYYQARGKRCQKRIVGAGRPVREATNIAANADAQLDGKEIDPAGRKRGGPADQRKQQVRQLAIAAQ